MVTKTIVAGTVLTLLGAIVPSKRIAAVRAQEIPDMHEEDWDLLASEKLILMNETITDQFGQISPEGRRHLQSSTSSSGSSSTTGSSSSATSTTSAKPTSTSSTSSTAPTASSVPDLNSPFMKLVPEYNSDVFKAGDKQQYQEYTGTEPPPQDIILPNNDVLNFDQRDGRSIVDMALNGNDKLIVDTLPNGEVSIDFWSAFASTKLQVLTDVFGTLEMNVTGALGSTFTFKNKGENFTIPGIEFASSGAFHLTGDDGRSFSFSEEDFAKYTRSDNTANLIIPSLGLDINFNVINENCGSGSTSSSESTGGSDSGETTEIDHDTAKYNYVEHGQDWPEIFPACSNSLQSPINLMSPVTKYGQSYEIFDYKDDKLRPEYWDLEDASVEFHKSIYSVEVYIDHNHGYAGFESFVGNKLMGAPSKWDAVEFIFHHGSEHLIDGQRFDLEMQIIHTEHIDQVASTDDDLFGGTHRRVLRAEDEPPFGYRRNLASTSASSSSTEESSSDEKKDAFRYAIVSILFSINHFSKNIDSQVLNEFETFFDELDFEQDDHISPHITFGNLMDHIDWSHRWVYKGSLTVPPCSQFVYWNIIGTVYPIKKPIVDAFNKKLGRAGVDTTGKNGNYRDAQLGLNLDVYYVSSGAMMGIKTVAVGIALISALFIR